jgi:hypothetical protein
MVVQNVRCEEVGYCHELQGEVKSQQKTAETQCEVAAMGVMGCKQRSCCCKTIA